MESYGEQAHRLLEGGIAAGAGVLSTPIRLYLAQIVIIMAFCQVLGLIIRRWNQPRVIAEVLGGILLGPTFLGQIPGFTNTIFPAESITSLKDTAVLGLVLFLFIVGLELDPGLLRGAVKRSMAVSFTGQFCAWMLSLVVSNLMYNSIDGLGDDKFSFTLFIGISMAVTAFPVLSRILTEQHLLSTKVGIAAISAAAFDDVAAWCMLALVIAIVSAGSPLDALWVFLLLAAYALLMLLAVRPLLGRYIPRMLHHGEVTHSVVFICLIIAIFSGWVTDIFGIDAIFGGFIAGLSMPRAHNLPVQLVEKIENVVAIVLLPLYFAVSGLKTDFTALDNGAAWGFVVLVISLSCIGKVVGCGTAARLMGMPKREALTLGFLMNTRGLVEIIILNIGLDAGVINMEVFAIMIVMAVFTTFLTSPVVAYLYPPKYHDAYRPDLEALSATTALQGGSTLPPPSAATGLSPTEMLSFAERRLRLLVCVPDIKALTTIVKVVRLISHPGSLLAGGSTGVDFDGGVAAANGAAIKPPRKTSIGGGDGEGAEGGGGGGGGGGAPTRALSFREPGAAIHAVRIVETSDNFSSDMMTMRQEETLRNDELAGLLHTFGQMNSVRIETHLALGVEPSHFATGILDTAMVAQRNTVLVPWLPEAGVDSSESGGDQQMAAMAGEAGLALVSQVLEGAAERQLGNVVVMLDRGLRLGGNRILVPYLGGADDEEALMLALALLHPMTELIVLRRRAESKLPSTMAGGLRASGKHQALPATTPTQAAAAAAANLAEPHPSMLGSTRLMATFTDLDNAERGTNGVANGASNGNGTHSVAAPVTAGGPLSGGEVRSGPQQRLLEAVAKLPQTRIVDVYVPPGIDPSQALVAAMPGELKSFGVRRHTLVVCGRGDAKPTAQRGASVEPSAAAVAAVAAASAAASGMGPHHTVTGSTPHRQYEESGEPEENVQRTWGHVFRSLSRGAGLLEGALTASSHSSPPRLKVLGRAGASVHRAFPDVSVMVVHGFAPATVSGAPSSGVPPSG